MNVNSYVKEQSPEGPIVVIIGAVSVGNPAMENDYGLDDVICVSNYNLSGACVCSKVATAFEEQWKIL